MSGSSQPLVSVIMNCYNSDSYLKEAIDSIYAQTYSNWEIIFWDNASTDKSSDIAKSYDNKVKYYKAESTTSLGEARFLAVEKSIGEYLAFLDCDDYWLPEKLKMPWLTITFFPQIPIIEHNHNLGIRIGC